MSILEIERINRSCGIQNAPGLTWRFELDLGSDPIGTMNKIVGVVRQIASHGPHDWPDDDFWKSSLP
jgi:hypothetical protein